MAVQYGGNPAGQGLPRGRPFPALAVGAVSMALTLAASCWLSGGQEQRDRTRPSAARSVGFSCPGDPRCICFSNLHVSRHCEGGVHIHQGGRVGFTHFLVDCDADTAADPYPHLSLARAERFADQGATLNIRGCPPPSRGYSSLVGRGEADFLPVLTIELDCGTLRSFRLGSHHFDGLTSLTDLTINCPSLSSVSADLLSGVSRDLYLISIQRTSIEVFPDGFFSGFHQLDHLSLGDNRISAERGGFLRSLPTLKVLNLSANGIPVLDDDVFLGTKEITGLDLSHNRLSRLPLSLCGLSRLYGFFGNDNRIGFIPQDCRDGLTSLGAVDLSDNRLLNLGAVPAVASGPVDRPLEGSHWEAVETSTAETFPVPSPPPSPSSKDFFHRKLSVLKLNFRNNSLAYLSDSVFFGLRILREVDVSHNLISTLPATLFVQNEHLDVLRLSHNSIAHLPEVLLFKNGRLLELDASSNRIQTLGSRFFQNLTLLHHLNLSNNSIDFLPSDVFLPFNKTFSPEDIKHLYGLNLNLERNLLVTLPILTLPRLTSLNLSRNRLTHFEPDALKYVSYLKQLDVSHNSIQSLEGLPSRGIGSNLPGVFFHRDLRNLSHVDLSHNRLTRFPSLEFVYGNLKSLNMSANRLSGFAAAEDSGRVGSPSSSLEVLDLSDNGFSWASKDDLCGWERAVVDRVKHLDLSWNGLNLTCRQEKMERNTMVWGCSTYFVELEDIEVIRLAHNNIEFIPMDFQHSLPKLRHVDLSHNRIRRLWYHDFLVTNGVTPATLVERRFSPRDYVARRVNNDTYYEFPNSHHLTIDVRHNQIEALILPDDKMRLVPQDCDVERQFARATVLLGGNPLTCSCQTLRVLQYSLKEIRPVCEKERLKGNTFVLPAALDIQGLRCREPVSVKGKAVSEPETWAHHLLPLLGLCNLLNGPEHT